MQAAGLALALVCLCCAAVSTAGAQTPSKPQPLLVVLGDSLSDTGATALAPKERLQQGRPSSMQAQKRLSRLSCSVIT
jgi:phospholipase/lecithinase/hemolysin